MNNQLMPGMAVRTPEHVYSRQQLRHISLVEAIKWCDAKGGSFDTEHLAKIIPMFEAWIKNGKMWEGKGITGKPWVNPYDKEKEKK